MHLAVVDFAYKGLKPSSWDSACKRLNPVAARVPYRLRSPSFHAVVDSAQGSRLGGGNRVVGESVGDERLEKLGFNEGLEHVDKFAFSCSWFSSIARYGCMVP